MPFLLLFTLLLLLLFWPYWYLYWQWCTWRQSFVNNACLPLLTTVTLARINDEHSLHFCLSGRCTDIPCNGIVSIGFCWVLSDESFIYPLQWHGVNWFWCFVFYLMNLWWAQSFFFCLSGPNDISFAMELHSVVLKIYHNNWQESDQYVF